MFLKRENKLDRPLVNAAAAANKSRSTASTMPTVSALRKTIAQSHSQPAVPVVQKTFILEGEEEVKTKKKLKTYSHKRSSVHDWAKKKALEFGPFQSRPDEEVCNHHWAYNKIQKELIDKKIQGSSIKSAADNIITVYSNLSKLESALSTHADTLDTAITEKKVNRQALEKALDYYIYKICDYPQNLFYWPDKTNNEPDDPQSAYHDGNLPKNWKFKSSVAQNNANAVLTNEKKRLDSGEKELKSAIG